MQRLSPDQSLRIFFGVILTSAALTSGCATVSPVRLSPIAVEGPVNLVLRPALGDKEVTNYQTQTVTKNNSDGDLASKTVETFDFKVQTEVTAVDTESVTYNIRALEKKGKFDLNDYAIPEIDEKLVLKLKSNGEVIEAKDFPRGTIFYVPPISLPKVSVKIGDSWPMQADWISVKTGIPLRMNLVSILKNFISCGEKSRCAQIEVSGDVSLLGMKSNPVSSRKEKESVNLRFTSRIQGFLLYDIDHSTILYSYVRSDEQLVGEGSSVDIQSCTVSHVSSPRSRSLKSVLPVQCQAEQQLPTLVD